MLKLTDIKKDYKIASGAVHALKGVNLCFRKSEFVCILGPSGCGKTTMLNIIGGLDHYTSGDLVIQGKSTKDFKDRDWDVYRNHRIGFVFQTYNLIPHQTVLANVELALTIAGAGREERRQRATEALRRVGLGEELGKKPNQLSGGQMQRVAIARALVNDPDILLADEPTGALDSKTSVQIMDLMQEIAEERLVIMVTHNPELAEKYATRIVRLHDGLVEADSAPYSEAEEAAETRETDASQKEAAEKQAAGKPKRQKKLRAKMGFFTSLALSARNLMTKKGRTAITSVAGSIGIISVCLVLALSSGFNTYIKRTEEDMLSYYPLEVTESTFDITAVMSAMTNGSEKPDMDKVGDRIYVDSFLTGLAQGMTVQNNISPEYVEYIAKGQEEHPEWFSAIQYNYGAGLVDNLFTEVDVGGDISGFPAETRYYSLSELKQFYISELRKHASQYNNLVPFADFFGDIVNKMPGTDYDAEDYDAEDYARFVLTQYDVIAGEFPMGEPAAGEREGAVLVVGNEGNDVIDLVLAQLGLIPEDDFLALFNLGTEEEITDEMREEMNYRSFEEVLNKRYTMYFNDAVYEEGTVSEGGISYPFTYKGQKTASEWNGFQAEQGIDLEIKAILRLKDGYTYGCLKDGLNLTEATVNKYIKGNMQSKIVKWLQSDAARAPEWFSSLLGEYSSLELYTSPASHLSEEYTPVDLDALRATTVDAAGATMVAALDDGMKSLGLTPPADGMYFKYILNYAKTSMQQGLEERLPGKGEEMANAILAEVNEVEGNAVPRETLAGIFGNVIVSYTIEQPNEIKLAGTLYITYAQEDIIRLLGGDNTPSGIKIFPTDFNMKEKVLDYLDGWNAMCEKEGREADKIKYTDRVGLLMGMVQTMLNVITYVLVAFTAISLIVSSVMIGIITYVSVVERVKEIGVLRSLGASKRDIKNLFNAETFIIGLAAGVFGVVVSYLLSFIVSLIIQTFTGIANIAMLPPLTAFIMVCISVALTLISGLIPAAKAAKKDPVIALRTE